MSLQSHSCTDGKTYWCIYKGFFMTVKIFDYVIKVFSLFSPSLLSLCFFFSFSTRQQSLEWLSHPCKGVNARLRVCVYVCNCVQDEPSTLALILVEDFGASHTPVRDGSSCPSLKEQTQLRPFLTQKQLRKKKHEEQKHKQTRLFARK